MDKSSLLLVSYVFYTIHSRVERASKNLFRLTWISRVFQALRRATLERWNNEKGKSDGNAHHLKKLKNLDYSITPYNSSS